MPKASLKRMSLNSVSSRWGRVASSPWGFELKLRSKGVTMKPQLMLGMVSEALTGRNHHAKVHITTD